MLDRIKQAKQMWQEDYTHGEIKEVTGLSDEIELAITTLGYSPEQIYAKLPRLKAGMTLDEVNEALK